MGGVAPFVVVGDSDLGSDTRNHGGLMIPSFFGTDGRIGGGDGPKMGWKEVDEKGREVLVGLWRRKGLVFNGVFMTVCAQTH